MSGTSQERIIWENILTKHNEKELSCESCKQFPYKGRMCDSCNGVACKGCTLDCASRCDKDPFAMTLSLKKWLPK
jgi:hypothetical protein